MREAVIYIEKYQRIYKRVLREAKKRDNDRYVREQVDRTKVMWRLINREIGKAPENEQKLQLRIGKKIISNPKDIDKLNTHFINTVEELVGKRIDGSIYNLKMKHCPNSIFIYSVTEEEVFSLTKSLSGKPTAGDDDIPENLVKQCIQLIKGPLAHFTICC